MLIVFCLRICDTLKIIIFKTVQIDTTGIWLGHGAHVFPVVIGIGS